MQDFLRVDSARVTGAVTLAFLLSGLVSGPKLPRVNYSKSEKSDRGR